MACINTYLADILRVCEIKNLIWVMRFQSPLVYVNFSKNLSCYLHFIWMVLYHWRLKNCKLCMILSESFLSLGKQHDKKDRILSVSLFHTIKAPNGKLTTVLGEFFNLYVQNRKDPH